MNGGYDKSKPFFTYFYYIIENSINSEVYKYFTKHDDEIQITEIMNRYEDPTEEDFIKIITMTPIFQYFEKSYDDINFKCDITKLSANSQVILNDILDGEIFSDFETNYTCTKSNRATGKEKYSQKHRTKPHYGWNTLYREYVRKRGWKWSVVNKCFREITNFLEEQEII